MPQYDLYADEKWNEKLFPQLAKELEPTTEVGDYYTGAEILLPRIVQMVMGHVVARGRDTNRNSWVIP